MLELRPHQAKAVETLKNGNVLFGIVGTGKSRVAVAYYERYESPRDVYVITTAKKRDSMDWQREFAFIHVGEKESARGRLVVDSWNNIMKYKDVSDAFFIFDEQRLVGSGAWVIAFQKIARSGNNWILLSGTPGDTWLDYAPVFIANGFYKNITQFKREHVLYEPFSKYPKVKGFLNEAKLEALRNSVLLEMPYEKHTIRHMNYWDVKHDVELFKKVAVERWNVVEDRPIRDVAELFRLMRKVVNSDVSRVDAVRKLQTMHPRLIVFYNFDYELEALRELYGEVPVAEYNGHRKQAIPETDEWVYLVQYVAGAEGWNCISTNAIVFYSQTYSWKNFEQCQGRIDRLNTPYVDLYYYVLWSNSLIDRGIKKSLDQKEAFNERKFAREALQKWDPTPYLEAESIQDVS